jgi:hypothetical protein
MLGSGKSPEWTGVQLSAAAGGAATANDKVPTTEIDAARIAYAALRTPDPGCRPLLDIPEKSNKGSSLDYDHLCDRLVAATFAEIVSRGAEGFRSRTWACDRVMALFLFAASKRVTPLLGIG